MLLSLSLAHLVSTLAVLATLSDWLFHFFPLKTLLLVSVALTFFSMRRWMKNIEAGFDQYSYALELISFIAILSFLIYPGFPLCGPLSREWDGANHLALAKKLLESSNHFNLVRDQFHLSYGPSSAMWDYPWGFHLFAAALSSLLHIAPVHLLFILAMIFLALTCSTLIGWALKQKINFFSVLAVIVFLIFFNKAIFAFAKYNYWSQSLGIFLCVSLFSYLSLSKTRLDPIPLAVLIAGIIHVYPIYLLPCGLGLLIYGLNDRSNSFKPVFLGTAAGILISLPAVLPYIGRNIDRLKGLGPLLWGRGEIVSDWIFLLLLTLSVMGHWQLIKKNGRREFYLLNGALIITFIFSFLGARQYWMWKLLILSLFLSAPALMWMLNENLISPLLNRPLWTKQKIFMVIFSAAVCAAAVTLSPFESVTKLDPVFEKADIEMTDWTAQQFPAQKVFYIVSPPLIPWLESLHIYPAPILNPEIISDIRGEGLGEDQMVQSVYFAQFQKLAEDGNLLCVKQPKFNLNQNGLTKLKQIGPWEIYQWNKNQTPRI